MGSYVPEMSESLSSTRNVISSVFFAGSCPLFLKRTNLCMVPVPHTKQHCSSSWLTCQACSLGCALTFASEAKFEIEAKNLFRLEAKNAWFHMIHFDVKHQKSEAKTKVKYAKIKRKNRSETKIKRKKWKKVKKNEKSE